MEATEPTCPEPTAARAPITARMVQPPAITAGEPTGLITPAAPTTRRGAAALRTRPTDPAALHTRVAVATTQPPAGLITTVPAPMPWVAPRITAPRVPVSIMRGAQPRAAKPGEEVPAAAGHRGRIAAGAGAACTPAGLAAGDSEVAGSAVAGLEAGAFAASEERSVSRQEREGDTGRDDDAIPG